MNKSTPAVAGHKLSKTAMKQLMGGSANINAWVCGGRRVIYYKRSECEMACTKPDTCNKFTIDPV